MKVELGEWAWIDMNKLTTVQLNNLRKRLTIRPSQTFAGGKAKQPIRMYVEDHKAGLVGVPRAFAVHSAKRENEYVDRTSDGLPTQIQTTWEAFGPYQEQELAAKRMIAALSKPPYGAVLQGGCGFGKTATGLEIARRLGGTILVLVHKEFLLEQWKTRILGRPEKIVEWDGEQMVLPEEKGFWPDAKLGIVRGDKCDFEGKDVVIAMVQSLASRTYPADLYRWPRTIMTDEVHRIGAATWAPVLPQFKAKYRIGLTATPRRKDGADDVFWWHIGKIAYRAKSKQMPFKVRFVETGWAPNRSMPDAIALSHMSLAETRNRLIADELRMAVEAGRKVLVMGERLNMLEQIEMMLRKQMPDCKIGRYTGEWYDDAQYQEKPSLRSKRKVTEAEKMFAERCQVIFATKQTVEEGLDIWDLDTLFMVTPLSDVEQAVGRIRRWPSKPEKSKMEPLVVDFVDSAAFARRKAGYRKTWYSANK